MSYIFMRSDERIQKHKDEINKLDITTIELEKIKTELITNRTNKYIEFFSNPIDICSNFYPIEYFKRQIFIGGLTYKIDEITNIIRILQDSIKKEYKYIDDIIEEQKLIDNIPDNV